MPSLFRVFYVSEAQLGSPSDLTHILAIARPHNKLHGIGGLLTYDGRNFSQLIEGPEADISALMRRIEADRRHRNLKVLIRQSIPRMSVPAWGMGYVYDADLVERTEALLADEALDKEEMGEFVEDLADYIKRMH